MKQKKKKCEENAKKRQKNRNSKLPNVKPSLVAVRKLPIRKKNEKKKKKAKKRKNRVK